MQTVYGLNRTKSLEVCKLFNYNLATRVASLNSFDVLEIRKFIENSYKYDSFVQREFYVNIAHVKKIKSYRGLRHFQNLPVRGQRTHTNARTQKSKNKKKKGTRVEARKTLKK